MSKIAESQAILAALQVPASQQTNTCCCALLALAGLTENTSWAQATNHWLRIHDVIIFSNANLGTSYAENSRETFRKRAMHHFRNAAFIEDNGMATNSGNYRYRLTAEMLKLIKSFGTTSWEPLLAAFHQQHPTLVQLYASQRKLSKLPVKINGSELSFSAGAHNQLQKDIIEEFAPRFAPHSTCLYVGDTVNKDLVKDEASLGALGITISVHDKMPDVVLYSQENKCLFLIEAVTSVGPMEPKRVRELDDLTASVPCAKIYITAFPDFKTFKKFADKLAWDTEVWIAQHPDHVIHYNGGKLLTPRPCPTLSTEH